MKSRPNCFIIHISSLVADHKSTKRVAAGSDLISFFCNLFLCLQYLPMDYLLKTEPTVYSFADLEREKTTIWDGVTNPAAVKHLRGMKPGERLVIYHTGSGTKKDEKSAVGTASVVAVDASDPKAPLVKIKVGKPIAKPRTLAEIKTRAIFAESPLVTQGRLSVVPLTAAQYGWLVGE